MIKLILACTDGSSNSDAASAFAIILAKRLGARLTGLHVLDSRMLEGPLMADISGWIGAQPFSGQLSQFRELMETKGETIMQAFQDQCEKQGVTAETLVRMGHPAKIILEEETRTELVVLGQRGEHEDWSGGFTGSTVERVIRHSIKPCLVVPNADTPVTRILVAYDGSGHASRALHEAVELATALTVPLVILTVDEEGDAARAIEVSEDGIKLARAHECAAANLVVVGEPERIILQKASELDCSMIVVGAYGHSKVRHMILGSTTTHLIQHTRLPVMLVR